MGNLRTNIHGVLLAGDGVQVFRETLPLPLNALRERRAGNVFHPLHQVDQPGVFVGLGGRKPHPAIAGHDGGDPMAVRGREVRVPGELAVKMGVDVDESGRHQRAGGVYLTPGRAGFSADLREPAVSHRDVTVEGRAAGAVH